LSLFEIFKGVTLPSYGVVVVKINIRKDTLVIFEYIFEVNIFR
jgi:hypothetical protein